MSGLRPSAVAIVPARGGSQGIPGKNLRTVGGRSLVQRAVDAAIAARSLDHVVVTTDDDVIADAAAEAGAAVIVRPAELATSTASSESALLHALDVLAEGGREFDLTVFLQCTSPLTTAGDIDTTVDSLIAAGADAAFSAIESHAFLWSRDEAGYAVGINHDSRVRLRRQDRTAEYLETGAVYVMRTDGFRFAKHRFFGTIVASLTPRERWIEIDEPADLIVAEAMAAAANGTVR